MEPEMNEQMAGDGGEKGIGRKRGNGANVDGEKWSVMKNEHVTVNDDVLNDNDLQQAQGSDSKEVVGENDHDELQSTRLSSKLGPEIKREYPIFDDEVPKGKQGKISKNLDAKLTQRKKKGKKSEAAPRKNKGKTNGEKPKKKKNKNTRRKNKTKPE